MGKVNGAVVRIYNVIAMKENTFVIKEKDKVVLHGHQVIHTKENIKMMKDMDLV